MCYRKYNNKERKYYNISRENACEKLSITKYQYNWFRRMGNKLQKIYEDNCNGLYNDIEQQYFNATSTIEKLIRCYADKLNLHVYFQTDPRGATIYLDKNPIPENNYTQATCIY